MPFDLGWPEIVLVLVIILIIFGAGILPQIGNSLGKSIREFRKARYEDEEDKTKVKTITAPIEAGSKEKS